MSEQTPQQLADALLTHLSQIIEDLDTGHEMHAMPQAKEAMHYARLLKASLHAPAIGVCQLCGAVTPA